MTARRLMLVVDSGFGIRNILRTNVYATLLARPEVEVILVSPLHDQAFRQEFGHPRVTIEPLPPCPFTPGLRWLGSLRKDWWAELIGVGSYVGKRSNRWGYAWRIGVMKALTRLLYGGDGHRLLAAMTRLVLARYRHWQHPLLVRHKPDLLFSINLFTPQICLEASAHGMGIPVATMIQSWDNPTTKGPLPFQPRQVIVWNDILRQEMHDFHQVPLAQIVLAGLPQADIYLEHQRFASRQAFCQRLGLAPDRSLIVYTTGAKRLVTMDGAIVTLLARALTAQRLPPASQLLVRLHPKDDMSRYHHLRGIPHLVFQEPGQRADLCDRWNPTSQDMLELAELMHHADVVINIASTITLDAAALDTPVINVAFDGPTSLPANRSCRRFYDYDHYRRVVATGGAAMACSEEELLAWIHRYLADPACHRQERARIVREQFWRLDGGAGQRVGEYLLALLDDGNPPDPTGWQIPHPSHPGQTL